MIPSAPTPNTPPSIKGFIGAAGKEMANVGQGISSGIKSFGSTIKSDVSQIGQAAKGRSPFSLQGTYKKAKRK